MVAVLSVSLTLMEKFFHPKKRITWFIYGEKMSTNGPRCCSELHFKVRAATDYQPF